ncbi:MAG: hypothetical protein C0518_00975 [Opitutus sp.]|nr:hypothetical protein [Opitutus sp.]
MRSPASYLALVRHLGIGWALFRFSYAMRRRLGGLRRLTPLRTWSELPSPTWRSGPPEATRPADVGNSTAQADEILRGRFRLFSHRAVDAGFPPDWNRNQLSGETAPADRHWSELGDFAFGDIKGVWELSRFSWAFALVRAHRWTGEERYADAFWKLFADWCERNPPNRGPNWMCGQEATFRLMAVLFAAENLSVPIERSEALARFVVASGRRIAANIDYALSQKNNHGVSECVGLISAALAIPTHPESATWLRKGMRELEKQLAELVYADGGFSQHSLIYHRVLLHDLVWAKNRLVGAGSSVPEWLDAAGRRATEFLLPLIEASTGHAPLYGPNDGANVLLLTDAEFLDLRPAAQLASAAFRKTLPFGAGPWDEAVAWLVMGWEKLPRRAFEIPPRWHAPEAGCAQLRNEIGRIFLRCPTRFRHRPSQADMLHVDVWAHGQRMALDGGSFSYNSRERFTALGSSAQHNVLIIDGREPMEKFSRFLYLPWPRGEVREEESGFSASHDGYNQLGVEWTRRVVSEPRRFVVEDHIIGAKARGVQWHWRLAERPWCLDEEGRQVSFSSGEKSFRIAWQADVTVTARLVRADAATAHGWWSPHYGEVEPACSLLFEAEGAGLVNLTTTFSAV